MSDVQALDVYCKEQIVGRIWDERDIRFVYAQSWIDGKNRPISPVLNFSRREYVGIPVESYFENLLPEAGLRELLKLKYQVTTTFGLLRFVGGDTASDLTILPSGEKPTLGKYQAISWGDITQGFQNQGGLIQQAVEVNSLRISLAGAQRKLGITMNASGKLFLPLGSSPSSHIVKPDIVGIDGVWASAINETLVMQLADGLGLGVAQASYQANIKSCLIKRYDRIWGGFEDGLAEKEVSKIHQLDLCQIDGKPSNIKYESDGGPSLVRCHQLMKELGVPAIDSKRLLQWLFFNLYVGNNDSHAKNLSVYFPPGEGTRLTPFYDLLCTNIYPGLSNVFAFKIGGENRPGSITSAHWIDMAKNLGFKPQYVLSVGEELANKLLTQLPDTVKKLEATLEQGAELTLIERLTLHIESNTKKFRNRLFARV